MLLKPVSDHLFAIRRDRARTHHHLTHRAHDRTRTRRLRPAARPSAKQQGLGQLRPRVRPQILVDGVHGLARLVIVQPGFDAGEHPGRGGMTVAIAIAIAPVGERRTPVGKGGGFMMDGAIGIPDEAKPENVKAMADITKTYGVYG